MSRDRSEDVGAAEQRLGRLGMLVVGLALLAFSIADLAALREQWSEYAPWWSIPWLALRTAATVALLAAPVLPVRVLRVAALGVAVTGLVCALLLVPATGVGGFPDDLGTPVILREQSMYALAGMFAFPPARAWVFAGLIMAVTFVDRWLSSSSLDYRQAAEDIVVTSSSVAGELLIFMVLLRVGRAIDTAADAAVDAARRDSAAEARELERRRVELLAHDQVLYALRSAAMPSAVDDAAVRRLALATLERLVDPVEELAGVDLEPAEFVRRLRGATTEIAPLAEFEAHVAAARPVPADVAAAILDAGGEALRNSVAHASSGAAPVARRVVVRLDDAGVVVTITDDGRGFRAGQVGPRRLGVRRSIEGRMAALPGGSAAVVSRPGAGTRVEVSWRG